ncbi:MAG: urease accessory protein [Lentisphaeria bacterium]|jgi:urease accessory protein
MLEAYKTTHLHEGDQTLDLVVSFDERKKSRYKTLTSNGQALGWFLERGRVLSQDDVLVCEDGTLVKVSAADEQVSDVTSSNTLLLTRAAYHLGNRHVPLQVGECFLRYQQDHVLDAMVEGLGLQVMHVQRPFQSENGAYAGSGHGHHGGHEEAGEGHAHSHSHSHTSTHSHG